MWMRWKCSGSSSISWKIPKSCRSSRLSRLFHGAHHDWPSGPTGTSMILKERIQTEQSKTCNPPEPDESDSSKSVESLLLQLQDFKKARQRGSLGSAESDTNSCLPVLQTSSASLTLASGVCEQRWHKGPRILGVSQY